LIAEAQGHHPGILIVRQENRQKGDLRPAGIVYAIGNLLVSEVPISDGLQVLNQWL